MFSPNTVARGWGSATGAWPGGIAEDQPGLLLSPAGGTSSLTRLVQLLGNAGWPGEHLEAQALPEENLLRGLSRARGQSAAPPHLAHNSTVPNPALHHLPSHQPCQGFCSPWAEQLLLKCCCASPYQGFSQLRELSISLFGDLTKTVVGNNKRQMRDKVRMGLLPLFFRMSDQTQSVAKVQISKLAVMQGRDPHMLGPGHVPASKGRDHRRNKAKRRGTPGLLPQAVVPSSSFCSSAGLRGSPPCCSRVPQMERAPTPRADTADLEDCRVLGEDNPQAPRPRLDEGCPPCLGCGLCSRVSPALLQPGAHSLHLHPCSRSSRTEPPRALLHAPLPSLQPSGRESSQQLGVLGGGSALANWGGSVTCPYPCALSSWCRTGAGLKNT